MYKRQGQQNFRSKIDELKVQEQEIHDSLVAVKDWYELVREAQLVIRHDIRDISIKFVGQEFYCFMAVSYTHLDVYKRQVFCLSAGLSRVRRGGRESAAAGICERVSQGPAR